jgi:ABC-type uncharacterized transport system substrate-binding protein
MFAARRSNVKRREFIIFVGGFAAWPLAAGAQRADLRKIGILITNNAEPFLSTFKGFLHRIGYAEGQNIQFEVRSANGNLELLHKFANELVSLKTDVIITLLTPASIAAKQATAQIPIVMAQTGDPVGNGLVASLARPGGNVTGLAGTADDLGAKLLEIIRDTLPSVARVAVLANAVDPFTKLFVRQIDIGGRALGISIQPFMTHGVEDFAAAFSGMQKVQCDAAIIQGSLTVKPAIDLALEHRLSTIAVDKFFPAQGGLMSYGPNFPDLWRRAAQMADKILRGAKPADIPVEEPTKYDLVINLKTADKLGVKVPAAILLRADEVIQ